MGPASVMKSRCPERQRNRRGARGSGRREAEGKKRRSFRTFVRGETASVPLCFLVLARNSFAGHEVSAPVAAGRRLKYKKRAPNGGGTCSRN